MLSHRYCYFIITLMFSGTILFGAERTPKTITPNTHDSTQKGNATSPTEVHHPIAYYEDDKGDEKDRVNLSHIPMELLKFGLFGLTDPKDQKALAGCEPEIRIRATSFKDRTNRDIADLVAQPKLDSFKGKKLFDLGGGHSKLLPYLRKGGVDAFSVDPIYGDLKPPPDSLRRDRELYEKELEGFRAAQAYEKENAKWLIKGKIEDLSKVRYLSKGKDAKEEAIADNSVDIVTSHLTWPYIGGNAFSRLLESDEKKKKELEEKSQIAQVKALEETLRILKPGGTARLNSVSDEVKTRFLKTLPPDKGNYHYADVEVQLPRTCRAILDRGFHVDGTRPQRFLLLVKNER